MHYFRGAVSEVLNTEGSPCNQRVFSMAWERSNLDGAYDFSALLRGVRFLRQEGAVISQNAKEKGETRWSLNHVFINANIFILALYLTK